jgi:glyoxylase-like metal-dependent hydrolase (beta-lactamase superfamily II)
MNALGSTMRIFDPHPNVIAFYDGRIDGIRAHSEEPNWLDDGAYVLGVCSYVIIDGTEALVYDTHISLEHARIIRRELEKRGVTKIRVVLSHWHKDHVAGNAVFQDCEIIANTATAATLVENKDVIEGANPPIKPLVMPNESFDGDITLQVGRVTVELRRADIHSHDATLLVIPSHGLFFAGDTVEDTITSVNEPSRLAAHLADIKRIGSWEFQHILPNHGRIEVIQAGGYSRGLITATQLYVEQLLRLQTEPALGEQALQNFAPEIFAIDAVVYFAPYEAVHRRNIQRVRDAASAR